MMEGTDTWDHRLEGSNGGTKETEGSYCHSACLSRLGRRPGFDSENGGWQGNHNPYIPIHLTTLCN